MRVQASIQFSWRILRPAALLALDRIPSPGHETSASPCGWYAPRCGKLPGNPLSGLHQRPGSTDVLRYDTALAFRVSVKSLVIVLDISYRLRI